MSTLNLGRTLAIFGLALAGSGCAVDSGQAPSEQPPAAEIPNEDEFVAGGKADFGGPVVEDMRRWRKANEARWQNDAHCALSSDCDVRRPIASVKNGQRVLIVITGVDRFAVFDTETRQHTTFATGYYVRELIDSLEALLEDGYEVDFATPGGVTPTVDENGQNLLWFSLPSRFALHAERRAEAARDYIADAIASRGVLSLEQALERVDDYAGFMAPGGHGPMQDFPESETLAALLQHMHSSAKPTAFICHAPIGLLSTRDKTAHTDDDGWLGWDFSAQPEWIYAGYRVSVASTAEEKSLRVFGLLPKPLRVTYYVDEELEQAGAVLVQNPMPSWAMAVRDRELISGQNPWSSHYLAEALIEALSESSGGG